MAQQLSTLDLVSARILPDGEGGLLAAEGFLVPRAQRHHVQEIMATGDGRALLAWLADPRAPLRMQTGEGHDLVFVTAVWHVPDPERVRWALPAAFRRDPDDRFTWLIARDDHDSIAGTVTLRGNEVTVETQSRERADAIERILRASGRGMRLVRREEIDADEAMRRARTRGPRDRPADRTSIRRPTPRSRP